ncbi:MAG: 50S ribosomal protein L4, partial [Nitrospinota bacterium]
GKTLIVVPEVSRTLALASRNLPRLKALPVAGLNVYDLLEADHVVVTPSALEAIGERLGP